MTSANTLNKDNTFELKKIYWYWMNSFFKIYLLCIIKEVLRSVGLLKEVENAFWKEKKE